ncbi:hypothetical protein KDE12_08785 [Campylobacter sp. faydin G-105]|uniref:hypothetical protein n=1 Tax=Campylobacter anatolicus TaxID=2829105 RepID=UPI001B8F8B85|nr:hypothetical protein [Campylobacter anatolicus]MBR8462928.1 hypothetical protein [Campylobacter anatolicus]
MKKLVLVALSALFVTSSAFAGDMNKSIDNKDDMMTKSQTMMDKKDKMMDSKDKMMDNAKEMKDDMKKGM